MKLLDSAFIEGTVLPLVIAFGLGVLAAGLAHDRQTANALVLADRAIDVAERFRQHCGEVYEYGHPVGDELITVASDLSAARARKAQP